MGILSGQPTDIEEPFRKITNNDLQLIVTNNPNDPVLNSQFLEFLNGLTNMSNWLGVPSLRTTNGRLYLYMTYTGEGTGVKPSDGYVGASGITENINNAVAINSPLPDKMTAFFNQFVSNVAELGQYNGDRTSIQTLDGKKWNYESVSLAPDDVDIVTSIKGGVWRWERPSQEITLANIADGTSVTHKMHSLDLLMELYDENGRFETVVVPQIVPSNPDVTKLVGINDDYKFNGTLKLTRRLR